MTFLLRLAASSALLCVSGLATAANPPTLEQLAAAPQFRLAAMSPDGRHIALTRPDEQRSTLVIVDAETSALVSEMAFPKYEHVVDFDWANDDTLVVANGTAIGSLGGPQRTGELISVSLDGKKTVYLFGYRAGKTRRNKGRGGDMSQGFVVSTLPDDRDEILVGEYDWSGPSDPDLRTKLHRINVYTGARREITQAPLDRAWITTDLQGQVRFASGWDADFKSQTYRFDATEGEWQRLEPGLGELGSMQPMGVVDAADSFLALISQDGEPGCLYRVKAADLQRERLHCVDDAEPASLIPSAQRGQPLGAMYESGLPRAHLFDPQSRDAQLYHTLQKELAPATVRFLGFSDDGKRVLAEARGDRDGGRLFLYDHETRRARFLFARHLGLDPAALGPTEAFSVEARDGVSLQGYLTLPPGIEPRALPLVVMPHGGPYGVRDAWEYDADAQALATRGYAVLKINFRGSGGRGQHFLQSGFGEWGGAIQDDIIDATRWAVASGVADPARICLMGASFGAYSALMSAIKVPEMFRCAVGYAGVYDLAMMFERGDIRRTASGRRYLDRVLGRDTEALARQSPTAQADRVQVPVLLVHGGADVRAPLAHAQALRKALLAADKQVEWFVVKDEAHGFFRADNRRRYYETVLTFLDKHIGRGAAGEAHE